MWSYAKVSKWVPTYDEDAVIITILILIPIYLREKKGKMKSRLATVHNPKNHGGRSETF